MIRLKIVAQNNSSACITLDQYGRLPVICKLARNYLSSGPLLDLTIQNLHLIDTSKRNTTIVDLLNTCIRNHDFLSAGHILDRDLITNILINCGINGSPMHRLIKCYSDSGDSSLETLSLIKSTLDRCIKIAQSQDSSFSIYPEHADVEDIVTSDDDEFEPKGTSDAPLSLIDYCNCLSVDINLLSFT